jgi:hypothetical protein
LTGGETGAMSGSVLGTVLGWVLGVKSGFVPGVKFGFGAASAGVSGGIVLLGFSTVLLGLVWLAGLCELTAPAVFDGPEVLPVVDCATAQQPHNRNMLVTRSSLCFMFHPW